MTIDISGGDGGKGQDGGDGFDGKKGDEGDENEVLDRKENCLEYKEKAKFKFTDIYSLNKVLHYNYRSMGKEG